MTAPDLSGPGLSRRNSTGETSRDAAKGDKRTLRERVLDRLGRGPAIPETILADLRAEGISTVLTSIRPRCSELLRMGLIRDSGQRQTGEGGKKAIVWRLADDAERAAHVSAKIAEQRTEGSDD
ncbi:hypothetical protein [Brevundimonas sp. TWP3-1-2b1]|uniref:hypothetical protein n=1 Tax=Brevundimonas sp. TWP3-1-2b1 TaxID=2804650 RepID=UPI003CE8630C